MTETDQTASAAAAAAEPTHIDASLASPVPSGTLAAEVTTQNSANVQGQVETASAQQGGKYQEDDLKFSDHDKAFFRANIRWIMTELDYARSGRRADERETLNP